jgi:hypothetical protein
MATATNPPSGLNATFDNQTGSLFIPVLEVNLGGQRKLYEIQMTTESQSATGNMILGVHSASEIIANARGRLRVTLQNPSQVNAMPSTRKKGGNQGNSGNKGNSNAGNSNAGNSSNSGNTGNSGNAGNKGDKGNTKVTICHKGKKTISVAKPALEAHLKHDGTFLGACDDLPPPITGTTTGTTTTTGTDKTVNITAIWLDIQQIKVCVADEKCQTIGGSQRLNLLDFESAELANVLLSPASFEQVRLVLGSDNTVIVNGETHPLTTPSGQQSGLKIVKPDDEDWTVQTGFETQLRLSFVDINKSVHFTPGQGYKLQPTLKLSYEMTALGETILDDLANDYAATGSIQINNDDLFTETEIVKLTFAPDATPELMRLSVDGQTWSEFEVYNSTRDFLFTDGVLGEKTVYVQYQTGGVTSASEYDKIILAPTYGAEYAAATIPTTMAQGITYAVNLSVTNTGTLTWDSQHSQYPVQVRYRWQDSTGNSIETYGNFGLFADPVVYSQATEVTLLIRAPLLETLPPNTSSLTLAIDLEEWGTTLFSEMGVASLTQEITITDAPLPERPTLDINEMPFGVGGQSGSVLNDPFRFLIKRGEK